MSKRFQVIIVGGGPVGVALAVELGLRSIVDELRAARIMPKGYPISGITTYGTLLSEYWYPTPQRELVRKFYYEDVERLPQYLTEKVLRTRMAELPASNAAAWVSPDQYVAWTGNEAPPDTAALLAKVTGNSLTKE